MKRIAVLSLHSSPAGPLGGKDTGGMSVYIRQLARTLAEQGYALDIFTRAVSPEEPPEVFLAPGVRLLAIPAGPLHPLDKLELPGYMGQFLSGLEQFRQSQKLSYQLIYSHYWLSGWAGQELQAAWNLPHFTMFHTVAAVKQASGVGMDEPPLRLAKERELAHACDRLMAATTQEEAELVRHYLAPRERIRIVPCGIDLERFRPRDPCQARRRLGWGRGERVVLYVGRLDPIKGIERLVRAMGEFAGNPEVRLVIVGGDAASQPTVERLQQQARVEGGLETLDFRGRVDQEELPWFYSAADLCAVVSYYESFGLVALESLACGTPVVASDVGILPQLMHNPALGRMLPAQHLARTLGCQLRQQLWAPRPCPQELRAAVLPYSWEEAARAFREVLAEFAL